VKRYTHTLRTNDGSFLNGTDCTSSEDALKQIAFFYGWDEDTMTASDWRTATAVDDDDPTVTTEARWVYETEQECDDDVDGSAARVVVYELAHPYEAPPPLVSSVRIARGPCHDTISIWSRGGLAGKLVVDAGDGLEIARKLTTHISVRDA